MNCKYLIVRCLIVVFVFGVFEANKLFVGKNSRYDMMFVILFHNNLKEKELPVSNHLSLQKGKNTHTNEK